MATTPDPVKDEFIQLLERARQNLSRSGDGSIRALAQNVGVSPSRVADWLRRDFSLEIKPSDPNSRLRRATGGFVASLDRAVIWLSENGLTDDVANLVKEDREQWFSMLLASYLPGDHAHELIKNGAVLTGIKDGLDAVRPHSAVVKARVEVRIPQWDAFTKWETNDDTSAKTKEGFFWSYAKAIFGTIDPVDLELDLRAVEFADALDLPSRGLPEEKVLALGLYETLSREFRGHRFVSIPLFRVPLVGLEIGGEAGLSREPLKFKKVFGQDPTHTCYAIDDQVAYLFLKSISRDPDQLKKVLDFRDVGKVTDRLQDAADGSPDGKPIVFLADSTIALGVFAQLKRHKVPVRPIVQECPRDVSYAIGFMLRNDDRDFVHLVRAAQRTLLETPWRMEWLLTLLADGMKSWTSKAGIGAAVAAWPEKAPIFLFDEEDLRRADLPEPFVKRLKKEVAAWHAEKEKDGHMIAPLWENFDWSKVT